MIAIREEIRAVESGVWPKDDNPLVNAPHTTEVLLTDLEPRLYPRQAAYPPVCARTNTGRRSGALTTSWRPQHRNVLVPPLESYTAA